MSKYLYLSSSDNRAIKLKRKGLVRSNGKAVMDDVGVFHPLGITAFWFLYGWKFDRSRVLRHLDFISNYRYDYIRVACQTNWAGESTDPNWPDYNEQLISLIDTAYDKFGLRVELMVHGSPFVHGGNDAIDDYSLANKIISVVRPRTTKIMNIEPANESFQNGPDIDTLKKLHGLYRVYLPNLVALSSPNPANYAEIISATSNVNANLLTIHPERNNADNGWRNVRQAWDFKSYREVVSNNEPVGPNSSVAADSDPLRLTMMRALGIMCGAAMYVLHVGDMVAGVVDESRGRKANLWEVANIDKIMKSVRSVDSLIPTNVENWTKSNNGNQGSPLLVHDFWPDGALSGINRNYCASDGHNFMCCILGVKGEVAVTALRGLSAIIYDPLTCRAVNGINVSTNDVFTLHGRDDTNAAFIIVGEYN